MPYIDQEARSRIDETADPKTPGELNYVITLTIMKYLNDKKVNYENMNAVVGVLESCKLEFYRRIVAEYEDDKMEENGDVY